MQIRSVGIDLGKTTFHLVALGASGKVLVKRKFTQKQLLAFTANMQTSVIGLEACSGAHFLGRALRQQGHDVRLIAAQFVKPFVKSNKNDFVDAEAIAEAVERKNACLERPEAVQDLFRRFISIAICYDPRACISRMRMR